MTKRKKATTGKGEVKKLKLKKETIKDLGAKSKDVKGGRGGTLLCTIGTCLYSCGCRIP